MARSATSRACASPLKLRFFEELAVKSLEDQCAMEAADEISFEQYLQRYFTQA